MSIISTGFKLPTAVIANASGVAGWTDPSNILLIDAQYAVSGGPTNILTVGNFNHNIPQGSTILNITLRVKGYRGSFNTTLNLYAIDDTTGIEYSYPYNPPFQGFSGTNTLWTLTPTLFATTWDVDQVNNIKLKLIADGELHVDGVEIDVTYDDGNSSVPETINYTNLVGIFQVGETVTGGTSGATGIVVTDNGVDEMTVTSVVGVFQLGETITGGTSFATATVDSPSGQVVCDEFIQAQPFQLSRAMTSTDTVLFLTSFNYPGPNGGGDPILLADAYGDLVVTVDQGKPTEENILVIGVDHNYQGTGLVRLNFGNITNRGLDFKYPYTHDITKVYNHSGTAEVVISNSAPFYDRFLKKCQIDALVSAPIVVEDEGVAVTNHVHNMNFTGNGVQVTVPDPVGAPDDVEINIPGGGTAPPVVVSTSSATSGNVQVPTLTWDHTSSGIDRLLVVQVSTEEISAVTGITYNGIALTLASFDTDVANNIRSEQWFLVAPPVGTYSIVVSLAPDAYISAGAESYVSVNQASPIGNTSSGSGNSNTPSVINTTANDNSLTADSIATAITPIAYSVGPGQTLSWSHTANSDTRQGASSVESAGTAPDNITMSYVLTQVTDWVMTAIEINGLPGATSGVQSVTDDGNGVVVVDNTDPVNPVIQFQGVNVDGVTVTGDGTAGNPLVASGPGGDTFQVKATVADTTPDFLQAKINVHSSDGSVTVTETITNPAGNEILDIDLTGAGGGGGGGSNIIENLNAGEDIDGVTEPKVVFIGSAVAKTASLALTSGNINATDYDYSIITNAPGGVQIVITNTRRASSFTTPAYDTTVNTIEVFDLEGNLNGNITAALEVGIYTDVAGAPGVLVGNYTAASYPNVNNNYEWSINLGDNFVLAASTTYWIVIDTGVDGGNLVLSNNSDVGLGLLWNGVAWVVDDRFAAAVGLQPFIGDVYKSYYAATAQPRAFVLGVTTQNITEGNPIDVIHDGIVDGYAGLSEPDTEYVSTSLGSAGELQTSSANTIKVGTATKATEIVINRVATYQ